MAHSDGDIVLIKKGGFIKAGRVSTDVVAGGGVDTLSKRYSMFGLLLPFLIVLPEPDGDLANAADRRHLEHGYAGIV